MSRPKAHYSMVIKNHESGARLEVELIDLPFTGVRQFRLRVNGQWARKMPAFARLRLGMPVAHLRSSTAWQASKTIVTRQVRGWLVKH